MTDPQQARRTFGPVVLLGLASAGLASVAGARPWVDALAERTSGDPSGAAASTLTLTGVQESPLAAVLGLVLLAAWGAILVTRGRFRRVIAWLGVVASLGLLATAIAAPWTLKDGFSDELARVSGARPEVTMTGWWWVALLAAVLAVATTGVAARWVRHWPEMGTKYDAPTGARAEEPASRPTENIDIWKALDEGRDPTA